MAPVRGRTLFFLLSFAFAIAAGCSLDFTVRSQPADAGSPPDATGADADAGTDGSSEEDGGDDAFPGWEAGPDGAVSCSDLKADLDLKKTDARKCQTTTEYCQTTVKNECDCDIVVAKPDRTATYTYVEAITNFKNAGCVIPGYCQVCPTNTAKNCLYQAGVASCYP